VAIKYELFINQRVMINSW